MLGMAGAFQNFAEPPVGTKIFEETMHCLHLHPLFLLFKAKLKSIVHHKLLALLTVSTLAMLAPNHFFLGTSFELQ